jgi:hypothetical protein
MGLVGLIRNVLADRRIRKLMRTADHFRLADAPENRFGRVTGIAAPFRSRALEAPISGRSCAYYAVTVFGHDGRVLRELASEQEGMVFVLDDAGCHAVIDPAHAHVSAGVDHRAISLPEIYTDRQAAVVARRRIEARGFHELHFHEAILGIGERIAVFGAAVREPDPEPPTAEHGYREALATRLRFTGTERFPLVISDDPRSV